jgi:uncharacterized protein (DUF924 family)
VDPEPVEGRLVSAPEEAAEIVEFWFSPECRKRWFQSTLAFDRLLRERYLASYEAARDGKLGRWEQSAVGALALVILLDQIPLNIFRDDARCFATEAEARSVAQRALARGLDRQLGDDQKSFLYIPFMHSEHLADQERSVELYSASGLEKTLRWARHHRDIVRRFGRFPHRNELLGRESSPQERAWLASPEAFSG